MMESFAPNLLLLALICVNCLVFSKRDKSAASSRWPSPEMQTPTHGAAPYYTHSSFGNVAATVNVGHPSFNYASIYGVQARFQAHVSAVMVLMDREKFPDAQGQTKDEPEGWSRRGP